MIGPAKQLPLGLRAKSRPGLLSFRICAEGRGLHGARSWQGADHPIHHNRVCSALVVQQAYRCVDLQRVPYVGRVGNIKMYYASDLPVCCHHEGIGSCTVHKAHYP